MMLLLLIVWLIWFSVIAYRILASGYLTFRDWWLTRSRS